MQIRVLGVRSGVQADPVDVQKQDRNLNTDDEMRHAGLMKGKVETRGYGQRGSEASVTHNRYNRQYKPFHSFSVEAEKCPFGYPFPKRGLMT